MPPVGPGIPIGRECGLKHRPVWVRVPPGALFGPVGGLDEPGRVHSQSVRARRGDAHARAGRRHDQRREPFSRSQSRSDPSLARPRHRPEGLLATVRANRQRPSTRALFGFYLGDGCLSRMGRSTALRVSCDRTWPGIVDDVERCIRGVHPLRPVFRVRAPGVVVVHELLEALAVPVPAARARSQARTRPGHDRVAAGRRRSATPPTSCAACSTPTGAAPTTGRPGSSRVSRSATDYPRWQFTNSSEEIRGWCARRPRPRRRRVASVELDDPLGLPPGARGAARWADRPEGLNQGRGPDQFRLSCFDKDTNGAVA